MALREFASEISLLSRAINPTAFIRYLGALARATPQIIRARSLAPADELMGGVASLRTWSGKLNVDFNRPTGGGHYYPFGLARELYARDVYLRAFERFNARGKTVLDLGGNVGMFSALAAKALEPARIVYVEPQRDYHQMMGNLVRQVVPAPDIAAIAGFVGTLEGPADAELIDLDQVSGRGPIAFVKMDIEGSEEALLLSAGEWLARAERIAMESHPDVCNVARVVSLLRERGFSVFSSGPRAERSTPSRAVFVYAARRQSDLKPQFRT